MHNKIRYSNNHYELFLQNNATKKIYSIGGALNISNSRLYLKFDLDVNKNYLEVNNYTYKTSKLEPGEYTYCVFWNILEIRLEDTDTNDMLDLTISVPYYDDEGNVVNTDKFKVRDLHPDMGLARIDVPVNDDDKYSELDKQDTYQSL